MKRRGLVLAGALLLAACATPGGITHQVFTPAPSSPLGEFFVEKPQVQSRETGDVVWQRNDEISRHLADAVRAALQSRNKAVVPPPAEIVRAKVYVAYGDAPVRTRDSVKGKPHIEIRLEVVDRGSNAVLYSTFTVAPIREGLLAGIGVGEQSDQLIQDALDSAAQDFASRL